MDTKIEQKETKDIKETTKIRHIVCSGGGVTGLVFYGILKETHKQNVWKYEDIETLYGTSVGSIILTLLSLEYEWSVIDDFIIKKPWKNVFKYNIYSILDSIQQKGVFTIKVIEDMLLPFFKGKNMDETITLLELYEKTKKELHIYATETNSNSLVDFSYKTHPNWRVIDVVFASCSIPIIFTPLIKGKQCFCDGSGKLHYPLVRCIEQNPNINMDEILGIRQNIITNTQIYEGDESTLFDYIGHLMRKLIEDSKEETIDIDIKNEYIVSSTHVSLDDIIEFSTNQALRMKLILDGKVIVEQQIQ
jgi:predicted acylesterase/phospholipase RssA